MNDHICQLMVNHLNLHNDKDFAFLLIKSIKNGSITAEMGSSETTQSPPCQWVSKSGLKTLLTTEK